ncbi:MAG TPA: ATP-dependent metallopeptidase FtsH/Yme1/Tma family protein [Candidatus Solibacter sp.]|nr:ATP-dependent metallopeptidase FtsH/Yme1/Tma family protein [Candidatus Solibacter sp.]
MNTSVKKAVYWFLISISALLLWQVVRSNGTSPRDPDISYSQFMADVDAGKVRSVSITGTEIRGVYKESGGAFHLTGPSDPRITLESLRNRDIEIRFRDAQTSSLPLQLLGTWAPLILLGALWFFVIRQIRLRARKPPAPPNSNAPINPA